MYILYFFILAKPEISTFPQASVVRIVFQSIKLFSDKVSSIFDSVLSEEEGTDSAEEADNNSPVNLVPFLVLES